LKLWNLAGAWWCVYCGYSRWFIFGAPCFTFFVLPVCTWRCSYLGYIFAKYLMLYNVSHSRDFVETIYVHLANDGMSREFQDSFRILLLLLFLLKSWSLSHIRSLLNVILEHGMLIFILRLESYYHNYNFNAWLLLVNQPICWATLCSLATWQGELNH